MQVEIVNDSASRGRSCADPECATLLHALDSHRYCPACRDFCDLRWECEQWDAERLEDYHNFLRQFPAMVKSWQNLIPASIRKARQAHVREIENERSDSPAHGGNDAASPDVIASPNKEASNIVPKTNFIKSVH